MKTVYDALLPEIERIPVIDTHEHLMWDEGDAVKGKGDVLREYLLHYMSSDIISAGLKRADYEKVIDPGLPIGARWRIVEPFWEAARYTGYGQALDISVKAIYGIDGVRGHTVEALNEAFCAARKEGHYRHVLRDLCNIETSLLDVFRHRHARENPLFKRVCQPTDFIKPPTDEGSGLWQELEERYGAIKSLEDWLGAFEAELDAVLARYGVKILKCAMAYWRSLRFEEVAHARAEELFRTALSHWDAGGRANLPIFGPELQDYMMHHTLKCAGARNLTIQIHTGLLEGNGNMLSNSDPSLLNNLFLKYPDVDFDLFHMGYPYQNAACALSKMFPNVTLDMCWAHIISPAASVHALDDFLDAVPYNKISAFGGDYLFVDGVYGHLHLSRQNVCRALAGKVERGVFGEDKALDIARALYYENPKRIFKL